jgi:hypothetical protein
MPVSTLHLLHSGDGVDLHQLMVHSVNPVSDLAWRFGRDGLGLGLPLAD